MLRYSTSTRLTAPFAIESAVMPLVNAPTYRKAAIAAIQGAWNNKKIPIPRSRSYPTNPMVIPKSLKNGRVCQPSRARCDWEKAHTKRANPLRPAGTARYCPHGPKKSIAAALIYCRPSRLLQAAQYLYRSGRFSVGLMFFLIVSRCRFLKIRSHTPIYRSIQLHSTAQHISSTSSTIQEPPPQRDHGFLPNQQHPQNRRLRRPIRQFQHLN
jgi:hypothetical protein